MHTIFLAARQQYTMYQIILVVQLYKEIHDKDNISEKYRNRPEAMNNLSLLSDHAPAVPKLYKQGSTLVGLKTVSFLKRNTFSNTF
jgi:hypothetical protein